MDRGKYHPRPRILVLLEVRKLRLIGKVSAVSAQRKIDGLTWTLSLTMEIPQTKLREDQVEKNRETIQRTLLNKKVLLDGPME